MNNSLIEYFSGHQYVERIGLDLVGHGMRAWMKQWMYRNSVEDTIDRYGNLMWQGSNQLCKPEERK
jgi:hypothetical protein